MYCQCKIKRSHLLSVAVVSHASWRVNLAVTQILPYFQNSLMKPHAVCWHHQGFHMIRGCSLTCCITPNLIIFTNKYIIALTVWVLKTCILAPLPGSPWTFWGKRIKFWKERSLSLLLNQISLLQKVIWRRNKGATNDQTSCHFSGLCDKPFFRWCRGLKCLTEWGRRRLVPNLTWSCDIHRSI